MGVHLSLILTNPDLEMKCFLPYTSILLNHHFFQSIDCHFVLYLFRNFQVRRFLLLVLPSIKLDFHYLIYLASLKKLIYPPGNQPSLQDLKYFVLDG